MSALPTDASFLVVSLSTAEMVVKSLPYFGMGFGMAFAALTPAHILRFLIKKVFLP